MSRKKGIFSTTHDDNVSKKVKEASFFYIKKNNKKDLSFSRMLDHNVSRRERFKTKKSMASLLNLLEDGGKEGGGTEEV